MNGCLLLVFIILLNSTSSYIAAKGDSIANLQEDLAAEQKARATYEKLIDLCRDNPDILDPLKFLRQREVVHFQRFGDALLLNFCLNLYSIYIYHSIFLKQ